MQGKMAVLGSQALQPLRWPHGVLKRCTCRASTFKMAVQDSQALRLPRFNLLDGRAGFSSAAPVTQTNGICEIIVQTKSPTKPTEKVLFFARSNLRKSREWKVQKRRCGENTILVLRARRFSALLNAPRCGVRSILAGQLTF